MSHLNSNTVRRRKGWKSPTPRARTTQPLRASPLAAAVAHELHNSLLTAAMILESPSSDASRDPRLAPLIRQSQSLSAIFLELSTSPDSPAPRRIDLAPWLRHLTADLSLISPATVRLTCEVPDAPAHAHVDAVALGQIIRTLVANAIEAMTTPGELLLRLASSTRPSDPIELRVSDTGPGVPPALRDRIFESGFSTRDRTHPRGLGLAVARALITQLGGTLTYEPNLPRGASFVLRVPPAAPTP